MCVASTACISHPASTMATSNMHILVAACALLSAASAGDVRDKRGLLQGLSSGYSAPISSYSAPAISYTAPLASYSAPLASYSAPAISYSAPAVSYSAPAISYSAPIISYSAPATKVVLVKKVVQVPREITVPQVVQVRKLISEPKVIFEKKLVPVQNTYAAASPLGGLYSAAASSSYGAGYASGW